MAKALKDVMTPNPVILDAQASVTDAARQMRDHDVGDVLVQQDGTLCGIVTDRDIVIRCLAGDRDPRSQTLQDLCSTQIVALEADASVDEAIDLMKALVMHRYRTHIRELDALLWSSLASSTKDVIELTPTVANAISLAQPAQEDDDDEDDAPQAPRVDARTLTAADVRAALERAGGVHDKAWRDLGLGSRHVLKRLKKKLGVE